MKKSFLLFGLGMFLVSFALLSLTLGRMSRAAVTVAPDGSVSFNAQGQVLGVTAENQPAEPAEKPEASKAPEMTEPKETPEPKQEKVQIETQTENGHSQVEVQQGDSKLKIEKENGHFQLQLEDQNGQVKTKIEPQGEDLLQIKERNDANEIKVSTSSAGLLTITRNRFSAATNLPLSVDLKTNQLTVTTPAGSRTVAVLPDQAMENIVSRSLLSQIGSLPLAQLLSQSSPSAFTASYVNLVNGAGSQPVYEINGEKTFNVLGIFPVTLPRTVTVSAVTGVVEQVQQSFLSRLLGLISR